MLIGFFCAIDLNELVYRIAVIWILSLTNQQFATIHDRVLADIARICRDGYVSLR